MDSSWANAVGGLMVRALIAGAALIALGGLGLGFLFGKLT